MYVISKKQLVPNIIQKVYFSYTWRSHLHCVPVDKPYLKHFFANCIVHIILLASHVLSIMNELTFLKIELLSKTVII